MELIPEYDDRFDVSSKPFAIFCEQYRIETPDGDFFIIWLMKDVNLIDTEDPSGRKSIEDVVVMIPDHSPIFVKNEMKKLKEECLYCRIEVLEKVLYEMNDELKLTNQKYL